MNRLPINALTMSLLVGALSYQAAAHAAQPSYALDNIQPVAQSANLGAPYEPMLSSGVYLEPVHYPEPHGLQTRMNLDIEIRNQESNYIRLDELTLAYPGTPLAPRTLTDHSLLSLPDDYVDPDLQGSDIHRAMLANGGFGISGLKIEQRLSDKALPFGQGMAVADYNAGSGIGTGYLVTGTFQSLAGDAPTKVGQPLPHIGQRGYIARYSEGGTMSAELYTLHEAVDALSVLQNGDGTGQALIAGRYLPSGISDPKPAVLIQRISVWDDTDYATLDADDTFGIDKALEGTPVLFADASGPCDVLGVPDVIATKASSLYLVVADLDCKQGRRAGVAALSSTGKPVESFGSGGVKVLAGPDGGDAIPVGIANQKGFAAFFAGDWIWLAAATGFDCADGGDGSCDFALTRFHRTTGVQHKSGWFQPDDLPDFQSGRPYDLDVDAQGRPVMAGTVWTSGQRSVAVHRFFASGQTDPGFGASGWGLHGIGQEESAAYGVVATADGGYGLAVRHWPDNGNASSVGAMKLDGGNAIVWSHNPYTAASPITIMDAEASFDYGYAYETERDSFPAFGVAETPDAGLVLIGGVDSELLINPCAANAEQYDEPLLDVGSACGGPWSILVGRYLPIGEPDSRRWLAPQETRRITMPEDRDLGSIPPSQVSIDLTFDGFDSFNITRDTIVFSNAVSDPETSSYGSYRFPLRQSLLKNQDRYYVKAHTLDHHHRNSESNRFAYDIFIARFVEGSWKTSTPPKPDEKAANSDYFIWKMPVRPLTAGHVIACRRTAPDKTPGDAGGDANFVQIQHAFNPLDISQTELVSYVHLRRNSIPETVCPNVCPAANPGCDVESEGVDPDGASYDTPVPVDADAVLGYVGNSGNTTAPHLHIHLTTDAGAASGPSPGSYPLLFHDILVQDKAANDPKSESFEVSGAAITHGSLVVPID